MAELVRGEGVGGERTVGGASIDALHADRCLAPGKKEEPDRAE
jgi:hypothetical protein